jgi:hypothetical protein
MLTIATARNIRLDISILHGITYLKRIAKTDFGDRRRLIPMRCSSAPLDGEARCF